MRSKDKRMVAGNQTIDKFLVPKETNAPVKTAKSKFTVPPSSGLPPSTNPTSNILKYPKNPEIRHYQQQIVLSCVCMNTLICLPTGLGKTHIAAVLIANFVNWFPDKKVVFLAPTRPLVRQQVSALNHLRDMVPKNVILQVSGQLAANKREQLYDSYRVIFGTPQTIENDIRNGRIDKSSIIMFIFDQCHRSVGDASYAKIVRLMSDVKCGFRIIGLSATPGHEPERVQAVIGNLNLVRIIYKDDKDPDVRRYLNEKTINEVQIRSNDVIVEIGEILNEFAKPSITLLIKLGLLSPWYVKNGIKSTSFFLIREQFSQKINNVGRKQKQIAYAALRVISFLIQSRKSLFERGFDTFKRIFFGTFSDIVPKNKDKEKEQQTREQSNLNQEILQSSMIGQCQFEFQDDANSTSLLQALDQSVMTSNGSNKPSKLPKKFQSRLLESLRYRRLYQIFFERKENCRIHPKLQKLISILQQFFSSNEGKAIVFTNYRVTAKEIQQYLKTIPQIKSQLFFGQSKTVFQESEEETSVIYLKQSEQLKIIQRFKKGQINTLISTSIGEQGLDIGEVDCIICYDGGHSPIRSIQRRGRTGRKRAGSVFFLLMEGKQWQDYKSGLKKQQKMKKMLTKELNRFQYYSYNSTLFEEKSEIIVEHYDNQLLRPQEEEKQKQNEKETKAKRKQEKKDKKEDGAATKKRRSKKEKQADQQKKEQNDDLDQSTNIEIKVTTIGDLLSKYKQEQNTSLNDNSLCSEQIEQQTINQSFEKPEVGESVEQIKQQQEEAQIQKTTPQNQQEQINQKIAQYNQENLFTVAHNSSKESISQDQFKVEQNLCTSDIDAFEDGEDQLFDEFMKYKTNKEAPTENDNFSNQSICQQSEENSLSSDEFIDIMERLKKRRQFQKLIDSEEQN